ncbi:hypothetical protein NSMM_130009 [Nitrosomonas mobilis]|uniref:Uncharacterized protein n=1 Tax=Nitrosomonas mobilis TaxID=51642 RepID=A0A1G5SAN4_9PROT|nr:hypothetical protein NSMM_130009 [Nitrosomonas mobilis]
MHSFLLNTEPVTLVHLFTVSTGASILKRSLYACSSPQPLSVLAQHVGCDKLKNLSNQEGRRVEIFYETTKSLTSAVEDTERYPVS